MERNKLKIPREVYEEIKEEIQKAILTIGIKQPDVAKHLLEHIVFDDDKKTVQYTGEWKWDTVGPAIMGDK